MKQLIPYFIHQQFQQNRTYGHFCAYTIFVDLSGFTPLTETLMKEGNEGAEELSTTLNDIFEPMVQVVYQRGGFIPYFAGDAFTGIFTKVENPADVVETAAQLRALFAKEGTKKTRFGGFDIGIKVGVSYGLVHWGVVGESLYTFYFRGEAIDNCAAAEHRASGQEVVFDPHFSAKIKKENYALESLDEGYYKLLDSNNESIIFPTTKATLPILDHKTLKSFLPKSILRLNEAGEFRRVTTLFISFEGVETHEDFDKFTTLVLEQFNSFSGYFKEIDFGDKGGVMLGFFGAPISFENNTERAVEMALSIRSEVEQLAATLPIKIKMGITAGLAFTGIIGGTERCQYAAVGNRVNIAARLMVKANWGEILVDEEIRKAKQYKFVHKGDISYKGLEGDIPTYVLLGRKVLIKSGYEGKMKGRKKQLKKLYHFVEATLIGSNNSLVYIFGEAGTGKSRLTFELRKNLKKDKDLTWIVCQSDQILQKPFNPFVSALGIFFDQVTGGDKENNLLRFEQNFDYLADDLLKAAHPRAATVHRELVRTRSILAAQIGIFQEHSLWSQLDAKGRFQNTTIALSSFFLGLSMVRPLVIELEDGHWFDENSRTFMDDFCRQISGYPIALVITSRYADDGGKGYLIDKKVLEENHIQLLEQNLENLSPAALKKLLEQKLHGATAPEFDKTIYQVTDGNPFYLEQVIAYYQEEDLLIETEGEWNLKENETVVSNSINAILMARVDRLSNLVKATVKTAAVIGREFEVPILSAVLRNHNDFNIDTQNLVKEQIYAAEKGQIWQAINEIKYLFRHSLLREAVYEMQLHTQLKKLHLTIAEAIEEVYPDTLHEKYIDLAFHYGQAEELEKTNEYLEKTAVLAKQNFQNAEAIKYYDRLLDNLSETDDTARRTKILLSKGGVLELIGEWETGEEIYRQSLKMAEQTDNNRIKGRSHTKLGYLLLLKGVYSEAREHFEAALGFFAKDNDQVGVVRVSGNLGNLFFRQGDYPQALDYFKKTIVQSTSLPYHTTNAQIVSNLGLTYMNLGRYEEGIEAQQEQLIKSRKNKDRRGMATLYVNLGIVFFEKGDYTNALTCYQRGLELSEELGNKLLTSIAIGCIGSVHQQQGDYDKAADHFIRDLELCEQLGDNQGIAIALGLIGELRSIEGDFDIAVDYLEHCVKLCETLGYQKGIAKAVNNLGDIYYLTEDYQRSTLNYQQAIDIARKIKNKLILANSLVEKAQTFIAMKQYEEPVALLSEARQIAEDLDNSDLLFQIDLLNIQLAHQQKGGKIALSLLNELLDKAEETENMANLYFLLQKIDSSHTTAQTKALELYQQLYQKTPKYIYKKRIQLLS